MSKKYPSQLVVEEGERQVEDNKVDMDKFTSFCPKDEAEYLSYIEQYYCEETAANLKIGFSISVFHLPLKYLHLINSQIILLEHFILFPNSD